MPHSISETVHACRLCNHPALEIILDVTTQPPANSLRKPTDEAPVPVPLILARCEECGAVQLTETVDPGYLFSHYVWVTGTSAAAKEYAQVFSNHVINRAVPGKLQVLEVASNDGTFLRPFQNAGHKVVGVDPAANIAQQANESGILTVPDFFGVSSAAKVVAEQGQFDVVFARNVLPHVKDPNDVVAGMVSAVKPGGLVAIEFHRADIIFEELHYDSIYHEHLFYHSVASIEALTKRHGLSIFDVTTSPISGGSYVAYFTLQSKPPTAALISARQQETHLGIQTSEAWQKFATLCREHRDELKALVSQYTQQNKKIIGFGASARSSTLLNFTGLDHTILTAIADNNPLKDGHLTPGTDIPVVTSKEAFALNPDVVVLLAWNFREELLNEIKTVHGWSGTVIVPLPGKPQVIHI